jgi:hypothetical protein
MLNKKNFLALLIVALVNPITSFASDLFLLKCDVSGRSLDISGEPSPHPKAKFQDEVILSVKKSKISGLSLIQVVSGPKNFEGFDFRFFTKGAFKGKPLIQKTSRIVCSTVNLSPEDGFDLKQVCMDNDRKSAASTDDEAFLTESNITYNQVNKTIRGEQNGSFFDKVKNERTYQGYRYSGTCKLMD